MEKPEPISDSEMESRFDDMLDEVYGEVNICGCIYLASRVLAKIDPIAYRCGLNDWTDAENENTLYYNGEDGEWYDLAEWTEYLAAKEETENEG